MLNSQNLDTTTVWLARHGEVHNPARVLYGRLPRMQLSPEGRRQAGALADVLGPRPLAAIYSSPMLRARRTAAIVLASHPSLQRVRIDADLLAWFRRQRGYQTRINAILRAYMNAHSGEG